MEANKDLVEVPLQQVAVVVAADGYNKLHSVCHLVCIAATQSNTHDHYASLS